MEYLQGFIFTSKYLFGRNGNTDLYYLFAAIVLCFYLWKRHDKLKTVAGLSLPFLVLSLGMGILYPWSSLARCMIFVGKMILNLTILLFVAANCKRWKIIRFVEVIVWIHAAETFLARLLPDSSLWALEPILGSDGSIKRLQLFYLDPGSMAFTAGLILILLVYQLLTEEVIWRQVIGVIVMGYDLYLSYGLAGVGCVMLAIFTMLIVASIKRARKYRKAVIRKYILGSVISVCTAAFVFFKNPIYIRRSLDILSGRDHNLNVKFIEPMQSIGRVLRETKFLGVGFGNANTVYALDLLGIDKAYPNSFLRLIAEGGIFGIALVLLCVFGLGFYCLKYGTLIDLSLYIYITSYQMIGGYFTDPTIFFVYGWIVGDCINQKLEATGKCRWKVFIPKKKEKLRIAQIGHKRIPSREGGVEIVVEEISKRLVRKGHDVTAYNRSGNHVSGAAYNVVDYNTLKEYEGIHIIKVPTIQKKGFAALIYSFIASLEVVAGDYDVVHYHAEGPCAFLWIPSFAGIRTVATIHGLDWARSGKWGSFASTFIKLGERVAVECADEVIVLSRHLYQYFWDNYHRKTVYIPNGIEPPQCREAKVITEKWGLQPREYILFLGRLTAEKGVHYLIEAFRELQTDKRLVIAGGASDTADYLQQLQQLADGDERILFTGFVQGEELDELYSNAYLYCLPSDLEGMPMSLLEAMSYGNCCLVSDIPECVEVVGNHAQSFVQGNVEDLRENLEELLSDAELAASYRNRSAKYIFKKCRWDDVVERTEKLYLG